MHTAYRMTIRSFGTLTSGRRSTPTVSEIFGGAARTKATPSLVSEAFCFQEQLTVNLHKVYTCESKRDWVYVLTRESKRDWFYVFTGESN